MERLKFKRKKYLILPKFQFKYAFYLISILLVILVIAEYFIFRSVSNILPSIYSTEVGELLKFSRITFIIIGFLYVISIIIFSIYITHRIAGPIFHIKKEIDQVGTILSLKHRFYLRKKDELKEITDSLNLLFERINVQVSEIKESINSIKKENIDCKNENCIKKINTTIEMIDKMTK